MDAAYWADVLAWLKAELARRLDPARGGQGQSYAEFCALAAAANQVRELEEKLSRVTPADR